MEIWKDLNDYPNYEISNKGAVRNKRTGHLKLISKDPDTGTKRVKLCRGSTCRHINLPQLLLRTFVSEAPETIELGTKHRRPKVVYLDGNIDNCTLSNLKWSDFMSIKPSVISDYKAGVEVKDIAIKYGILTHNVYKLLREVEANSLVDSIPKLYEDEDWREVPDGYKDIVRGYFISNYGRLFRMTNTTSDGRRARPMLIKPTKVGRMGRYYNHYHIPNKSGGKSIAPAHQLVMRAFSNVGPSRPFVDHIDNNPQNNHISNLRWCTHDENMFYARKSEVYKDEVVELYKQGKFPTEISRLVKVGKTTIRKMLIEAGVYEVRTNKGGYKRVKQC